MKIKQHHRGRYSRLFSVAASISSSSNAVYAMLCGFGSAIVTAVSRRRRRRRHDELIIYDCAQ